VPERPDLEYVVPILARELRGATIAAARASNPVVLRVCLPERIDELLPGEAIRDVTRRAHFVLVHLEGARAPTRRGREGRATRPRTRPRA
jgi:formamidopyrimidine-DNA glycosylase